MIPIATFSLGRAPFVEAGVPFSDLLRDGRPTAVRLPGVVLEAQYPCGAEYLLLTTEDVPYEEALHVILLGPGFSLLDHLELGHPYAPGVLTDLQPRGFDTLRFSFFGGDLWELTVAAARRWLRPREAPTGVRGRLRRLLAPRRLVLERLR